jgi:PAS domain S-box-containing protein
MPATWSVAGLNRAARSEVGTDPGSATTSLGSLLAGHTSGEAILELIARGEGTHRVATAAGPLVLELSFLDPNRALICWGAPPRQRFADATAVLERQIAGASEVAGLGLFTWDVVRDESRTSRSLCRILGLDGASALPALQTYLDRVHPDDRDRVQAELDRALAQGTSFRHPVRIVRPDGQVRVLDVWADVLTDEQGAPRLVVGVILDATGRERLLLSLHQRFRELTILHETTRLLQSENASPRSLLDRLVEMLPSAWPNQSAAEVRIRYGAEAVESGGFSRARGTSNRSSFVTSDGTTGEVVVVDTGAATPTVDFEPIRLLGSITEILRESFEHQNAARHLDRSNQRLDLALQVADLGLVDWDIDGDHVAFNQRCREILGLRDDESRYPADLWSSVIHPDDRALIATSHRRHVEGASDEIEIEHRVLLPDGGERWVATRGRIVERDIDGGPRRMVGIVRDTSNRRRAIEEREELERRLRQAEKMESIGRLAAGIAHDFNNLLTVIDGYGELLSISLGENATSGRYVDGIREASARAARMTKQLLTFSRNQVVRFEVIELPRILQSTRQILGALLPETIDLQLQVADGLWSICADPTQLEQVLINLALNARDAMPDGGRLVIALNNHRLAKGQMVGDAELPKGDYIRIEVTDNGEGMTGEVQKHVFEPFFTTKRVGQGTGLGLSTVYGIVKQTLGAIAVDSALGRGTRFEILLPRAQSDAESQGHEEAGAMPDIAPARILLVEDDPLVRTMVAAALADRGHQVTETQSPREALARLPALEAVDLLLTDVILPQMNGIELAGRVERQYPGLRVLFISGYPDQIEAAEQSLDERHDFLAKPFAVAELIRRVHRLLERPSASRYQSANDVVRPFSLGQGKNRPRR